MDCHRPVGTDEDVDEMDLKHVASRSPPTDSSVIANSLITHA